MDGTRLELSPRWVRTIFGGTAIGDSRRMRLLYEPGRLPVYYFPEADVRMELLTPAGTGAREGAEYFDVRCGGRQAQGAAWRHRSGDLAGFVAFDWNSMDGWFEEDDEIFVHPRDPYKRIDVLRSSRHVRVVLGGETVADTHRPSLLFETHLPTRYYIPRMDVRMEMLLPSGTTSRCPYKGVASYWSAEINGRTFKDVVWTYQVPIPECPKIEQLLCFFNERVDAIYVDGELEVKPQTKWS